METLIAFPLFAAILGVAIFIVLRRVKKNAQAWEEAARQLGLSYVGFSSWTLGTISGDFKGYPVRISTFTRGSGKNSQAYTRIETETRPSLPSGLKIYRETAVWSEIGKFFGGQDIQTGDQRFDDLFMIKGQDVGQILALLDVSARRTLIDIHGALGGLDLDSGRLCFEARGVVTDVARLREIIEAEHRGVDVLCRRYQDTLAGL